MEPVRQTCGHVLLPDFFSVEEHTDVISQIFARLTATGLSTASLVSHTMRDRVKTCPEQHLFSLANLRTLDNATVQCYQDRVKIAGVELTFEQAVAHCLRSRNALQRGLEDMGFYRVELAHCELSEELMCAFMKYGSGIRHLALTQVTVPPEKTYGLMHTLSKMSALESLSIESTTFDEALDLSYMPHLTTLRLASCTSLTQPPILPPGNVLESLAFIFCSNITHPPDLTYATHLKVFSMSWSNLEIPPIIPPESLLEEIDLSWTKISLPPDLKEVRSLKKLCLAGCYALVETPLIPEESLLEWLDLGSCTTITSPPDITHAPRLRHLSLEFCDQLQVPLVIPSPNALERVLLNGSSMRWPEGWDKLEVGVLVN